jgi:transcriptional regulator with XRE-family HTH domain
MPIGTNITRIRKEQNLTQKQLAELCGTSKQHISLIERGKISAGSDTLEKIAKSLHCELRLIEKEAK